MHLLRRGLCHAYVAGELPRFGAAIVQGTEFLPDELMGFGDDPSAMADLLALVHGWRCVDVAQPLAPELGRAITSCIGRAVRSYDEIHYALRQPVVPVSHPTVRLLAVADLAALEAAPAEVRGAGFGSTRALLAEGVVAAGILDGRVIAIAHTSAITRDYADIGVATLSEHRGQGLATAGASLVARELQCRGLQPVWSTGVNSFASQRVAEKLGFGEVARKTHVILA